MACHCNVSRFQNGEILFYYFDTIGILNFILHKPSSFPPPHIVFNAQLVNEIGILFPWPKDTGLSLKLSDYLGSFQLFAKFVNIFVSVLDYAVAGIIFEFTRILLLMLYDVVLFATSHESWENIDRVIGYVKEPLLICINKIWLIILHILLYDVFPNLLIAIEIELDFTLIGCSLGISQIA